MPPIKEQRRQLPPREISLEEAQQGFEEVIDVEFNADDILISFADGSGGIVRGDKGKVVVNVGTIRGTITM